ncbi:MAG: MT-A70 family methyltransferase [Candidatus Paceibacterota bacterium]
MSGYDVVLADPPWRYDDKCVAGKRGADFKYSTMSFDELRLCGVHRIISKNSLLFLWTTGPMMHDAISLMPAWGFDFKTVAFVWIKASLRKLTKKRIQSMLWCYGKTGSIGSIEDFVSLFWGMGSTTRVNAEFCLLGVGGKGVKRKSASVHQVVLHSRLAQHSAKPDEVRNRIDKLVGNEVSKVELFARERAVGWDATGLELDGVDINDFTKVR